MNRENLLKVADAIEHLRYEQHQTTWDGGGKPRAFCMSSGCGAACCIAGWTGEVCGDGYQSLEQARETLGLTQRQADALFIPPGYAYMKYDGDTGAQVLRLMANSGDGLSWRQIVAFWREPWAGKGKI